MSNETTSRKRVLAYLKFAIKLEEGAIKRYANHIEQIKNPDINTLLEGIRRNEERHLKMLTDSMKLQEKMRRGV